MFRLLLLLLLLPLLPLEDGAKIKGDKEAADVSSCANPGFLYGIKKTVQANEYRTSISLIEAEAAELSELLPASLVPGGARNM